MLAEVSSLPLYGVGLGYRKEIRSEILSHREHIDWLELIADKYFSYYPMALEEVSTLAEDFTLIPHGLELSIGSHSQLDESYCDEVVRLVSAVKAPFYSDHLCITRGGGLEMAQLTPLPFTEATVRRCAQRARELQERLGVPFLLENIARVFALPGEMDEVDFLRRIIEEAGCFMLLDLTNLYVNSENFDYNPYRFIDRLPLERIVQIHLAGSEKRGDTWVDTHSQSVEVHPEVWDLLAYVVKRAPVKAVLLERDQNFPEDFAEITADLDTARSILG